jgi:ectoine hydroxylase-related dioxygenase (phytanoyl-CoA dioxygenase family)
MLEAPDALPMPAPTDDVEQAKSDLSEYGICILTGVLTAAEVETLRNALEAQAMAERNLGDKAPPAALAQKQLVSNLVNKGQCFLDLVTRPEVDELAGHMLGRSFLLSSLTGGFFHGTTEEPQQLHRDQGQVPATADFVASCNLFWLLDDFTPASGSTYVVPGSHRWPPEHLVTPPPREVAQQITAPVGSVVSWDGRIWHGMGVNMDGSKRRSITTFFCLPWTRQQENWGVTCLQEVLDEASPKLRARLGLRTYGTLGMMSGTRTQAEGVSLGNYDVEIPEFVIGEGGALHRVRRVARKGD